MCYVYPTKKVRNFGFVLPKRNDFTFQQLAHLRNNWGQLFILTLNVAFKDIYLTYMIKYNWWSILILLTYLMIIPLKHLHHFRYQDYYRKKVSKKIWKMNKIFSTDDLNSCFENSLFFWHFSLDLIIFILTWMLKSA